MSYAIDTSATPFIATGIVHPVPVFGVDSAGNSRPTGEQATDDSGVPLWEIEVLETVENFGKSATETVAIQVPSRSEPSVSPMTRAQIVGLTLDVYLSGVKAGRPKLGKVFRAASVGSAQEAGNGSRSKAAEA